DYDAVQKVGHLQADARRDLAAHAVPVEYVALASECTHELGAGIGHGFEREIIRQRGKPVPRRVPCDDAIAARAEPLGLRSPVLLRAVDAVKQEHGDFAVTGDRVVGQSHLMSSAVTTLLTPLVTSFTE